MHSLSLSCRQSESSRRKAFTLVELLVNIAILAVLAHVLLPVFASVREVARKSSCAGNLSQISLGILQYAQDYDEHLPPYADSSAVWLPARMSPYVGNERIWKCPSADLEAEAWDGTNRDWSVSYGMNLQVSDPRMFNSLAQIQKPSETVLLCENKYNSLGAAVVDPLYPDMGRPFGRHSGIANVSFVDGHVKSYTLEHLQRTATYEDGNPLYGISSSVLWNSF